METREVVERYDQHANSQDRASRLELFDADVVFEDQMVGRVVIDGDQARVFANISTVTAAGAGIEVRSANDFRVTDGKITYFANVHDTAPFPMRVWKLKQIDAACDRFEAAWRSGEQPDLGAFLASIPEPARARLFSELLPLDLEFRHKRGEQPDAAEYRDRFPEHLTAIEAVFGFDETPATACQRGRGDRTLSVSHVTEIDRERTRDELFPALRAALGAAGYEILGELGQGGMGIVYLARRLMLNRLCAVKMIRGGAEAGPQALHRFFTEAEAVARLRHPNIVQLYHIGRASGLPFVELEYLAGGSLDRTMDGTPWAAAKAAGLVEVLSRAIAEAHRRGIIHRDLKPANILLDPDGRPKVADFGLAKILDSDDGLTATQAVLGSPRYMAPEQAEGQTHLIGPWTDVYALGAILYELLTGRPPFEAATALETLALVKETDPVPLSRFQLGLPRDLETICLTCLEKNPAERYATAEALADDLSRYLSHEPIRARPASAWERARKWARRRPTLAVSLALNAAAILFLLGGALYFGARLRAAVQKAQEAERMATASSREARERRDLALKALDRLVSDVPEELGETPATRPLRRSLLETAIPVLDAIARDTEASAPDLRLSVAHQKPTRREGLTSESGKN
jgi:hypothetical protein